MDVVNACPSALNRPRPAASRNLSTPTAWSPTRLYQVGIFYNFILNYYSLKKKKTQRIQRSERRIGETLMNLHFVGTMVGFFSFVRSFFRCRFYLNYGPSSSSGRESKSQTSGWQQVTPSVMTVKNLIGFSQQPLPLAAASWAVFLSLLRFFDSRHEIRLCRRENTKRSSSTPLVVCSCLVFLFLFLV